jgi:hypothetical protein
MINSQAAEVTKQKGKGDLTKLLNAGETWTVS